MNRVNNRFKLNLNCNQLKNAKNKLRNVYVNVKFLRERSGFGWDNEKQVPTADSVVWAKLLTSHPRRAFAKYKDKPFPLYDLAHQVFSGTFATGKSAAENLPNLKDGLKADTTPTNQEGKRPAKTTKQPAMILDPDDSNLEINPPLSAQQMKRTQKGKNEDIKADLGGLTNAIEKLAKKKQSKTSQPPPKTCNENAMEQCSTMFANDISDKEYLSFIGVLEDENKARTFLTLAYSPI
ncbi:hypothetical protein PCANC_14852 [Puccinia coronata f. sp. avenae]|uniref:Myb/SANT-like domain-containing protein n=1 Tax=Puccinia coronata f. sp. avenae TaxID=200324 RepID=A0A2N5UI48_9BASI|nr:hypothetical protein PCANC_14852 [Puccinia coronata f. sp. avenae]